MGSPLFIRPWFKSRNDFPKLCFQHNFILTIFNCHYSSTRRWCWLVYKDKAAWAIYRLHSFHKFAQCWPVVLAHSVVVCKMYVLDLPRTCLIQRGSLKIRLWTGDKLGFMVTLWTSSAMPIAERCSLLCTICPLVMFLLNLIFNV